MTDQFFYIIMKKIFLFFAAAMVAALCLTSCNDKNLNIIYDVTISGDADGEVEVSFPNGQLNLDGKTDLAFHYGNAVTYKPLLGAEAIVNKAADDFSAAATSGSYYLHVKGYVTEPVSSLKIEIDKVLTNRDTTKVLANIGI